MPKTKLNVSFILVNFSQYIYICQYIYAYICQQGVSHLKFGIFIGRHFPCLEVPGSGAMQPLPTSNLYLNNTCLESSFYHHLLAWNHNFIMLYLPGIIIFIIIYLPGNPDIDHHFTADHHFLIDHHFPCLEVVNISVLCNRKPLLRPIYTSIWR